MWLSQRIIAGHRVKNLFRIAVVSSIINSYGPGFAKISDVLGIGRNALFYLSQFYESCFKTREAHLTNSHQYTFVYHREHTEKDISSYVSGMDDCEEPVA
jgi:hypothetical protein